MKWEYLVWDRQEWDGDSATEKWLNEQGENGWELIHVSQSLRTFFFKRQVKEEKKTYESFA